jgi:hypothetical protein
MLTARKGDCRVAASVVSLLLAWSTGCGDLKTPAAGEWRAVYDTIDDTVVVRTVAGSIWGDTAELVPGLVIGVLEGADEYMFGSIRSLAVGPDGSVYVYDRYVRELRKYAPEGTYLTTFGREGAGPGEYRRPDGGLAVLPDGRVVLRDPGNTRITVYSSDGDYLSSRNTAYPFGTSDPLFIDTAGNSYAMQVLNLEAPPIEWERGLIIRDSNGTDLDTVALPTWDYELPQLFADGNTQHVPFAPWPVWSVSPLGYVVAGLPTRYRLNLYLAPHRVLSIGRENWQPVGVLPEEREEQQRLITASMWQIEPGWSWEGPPIPAVKAPYHDLFIGGRGRIWLRLHQRAHRAQAAEGSEPRGAAAEEAAQTWVEPVAFDVFQPDGGYLGFVRAPPGMQLYPRPVARGDTVWAVVEDELEVQRIVRLILQVQSGSR